MELLSDAGPAGVAVSKKETIKSTVSVSSLEDDSDTDSLHDDIKLLNETGAITKEKAKRVFRFKCKFSGTICDVMTRRGWVEQEDELSDKWDIFWCDVSQLRDMFIISNTRLQDHQRISHFRSCFEICRKNLMVKNLKRLQYAIYDNIVQNYIHKSRIRKTLGKEESQKLDFFPTTYILPNDHKIFLQEFRRISDGKCYWIIKPAAGAQGRGIFIFSQLSEYNNWRRCYHETLRHLQITSTATTTTFPATVSASPESAIAPYIALSATQLNQVEDIDTDAVNDNLDDEIDIGKDVDDDSNYSFEKTLCDDDDDLEKGKSEGKKEDIRVNLKSPADNTVDATYKLNNSDLFGPTFLLDAVYKNSPDDDSSRRGSSEAKDKSLNQTEAPKNQVIRADVFVMQRYIQDPYLIGGRKFDLRIFVLVTSYKPLTAWIYRDGFARFCTEPFSMTCPRNMYVHLTNVAVQKTSENYDEGADLKWALKKFRSYFISRHGRHEVFRLMNKIDTIVVRTLQSILHVVVPDRNSFELYGFDVLIDVNMKPWLLEVNASPAFTPSSEEDYRLKCCLLDDTASVLDLEGRRTGKEKQVGGYDLFWDNGPVYAEPVCCYGSPYKKTKRPKLNSFLGCESNRKEKLAEMYKNAHNVRKAQNILGEESIPFVTSVDE